MTAPVSLRQQRASRRALDAAPELTHVNVLWISQRIENRIRFGRIEEQHVIDRHRRVVSFAPDRVFAFLRWASSAYGTVESQIDILRAVAPGEGYTTVVNLQWRAALADPRRLARQCSGPNPTLPKINLINRRRVRPLLPAWPSSGHFETKGCIVS